jgi:hypothetical protein
MAVEGGQAKERTYSRDQVSRAINAAADMATQWVGREDDGSRVLVNLVVNVTLERLEGRGRSVPAVIRRNYSEGPEQVRSWCEGTS